MQIIAFKEDTIIITYEIWIQKMKRFYVNVLGRRVCKSAKSACYLHRVCLLAVCWPSAWNRLAPTGWVFM